MSKDEKPVDLVMWGEPGWDAAKETSRRIAAENARKTKRPFIMSAGAGRVAWFAVQVAALMTFAALVMGMGTWDALWLWIAAQTFTEAAYRRRAGRRP